MVAVVRLAPRGESSVLEGVNPDPDKVRTSSTCSLLLWPQVGYLWIYTVHTYETPFKGPFVITQYFTNGTLNLQCGAVQMN